MSVPQPPIGTVYGVLLNDRLSQERLGEQFKQDPYKAPPIAPILYVKPANTFAAAGGTVCVPRQPGRIQIGATIGAVIGMDANRVNQQEVSSHIKGYRIVADVSLPHDNFYRPAIRERCRDGFCPMSEVLHPSGDFDPMQAPITVRINGNILQERTLANQVRPLDMLLCDVTEFMTLRQADVMLLGLSDQAPMAHPGDEVSIAVEGLGMLRFFVSLEEEVAQ